MTNKTTLMDEMNGLTKRMRTVVRDQAAEIESLNIEETKLAHQVETLTADREKLIRLVNDAREALALAVVKLAPGYPLNTDPRYEKLADVYDRCHFPLNDDDSISTLMALLPSQQ